MPRRGGDGGAGLPCADIVALASATLFGLPDVLSAIIGAAHHHHADVVVIGADTSGWLSHLVDDSVARQLLRKADFSVLVVAAEAPVGHT